MIRISNTTTNDWEEVTKLFKYALSLQGKDGYRVWDSIDEAALLSDIKNKYQYKIVQNDEIICIFSIQYQDPVIWRDRENNDSIYLHRIVTNAKYKGQKCFAKVLNWAKDHALRDNRNFVRMDTWADNPRIIDYYKSFGFQYIEHFTTGDDLSLPKQHRNVELVLMELKIGKA